MAGICFCCSYFFISALLPPTLTHPSLLHLLVPTPSAYRWFCLVVAGICFRCSYYFIWSVAEAAVILSGFGFSGWSDSFPSRPDWSRAENANFIKCEITTSLAQMPAYWNMGVGTWLRTCAWVLWVEIWGVFHACRVARLGCMPTGTWASARGCEHSEITCS
ncbi:unnamed protein product [Closterium sp. NIES-54]